MTAFVPTDSKEINGIVQSARDYFNTGVTKNEGWRRQQLEMLLKLVEEQEGALYDAVYKDLHKPKHECGLMEINMIKSDIAHHLNALSEWMKPQFPSVPLIAKLDNCQIRPDPLGVVLIIGAWNYPIQLTLLPLIGALSAGNTVVIKPSELAEHTAKLLADVIPKYLDSKAVYVVNGAVEQTTRLLENKFDKILYTGNGVVGRIVMTAAAKHLTPVVLELGGKSPAVFDSDVDLKVAARRLAWGKFINCGQTCIAPDYVMCPKSLVQPLVKEIEVALEEYFGKDIQKSENYCRIINQRHFKRLEALLGSGTVALGGKTDEKDKYIAPTVLTDVKIDSPVMRDEIFGPILPILTVDSIDEAIAYINKNDKPLALYVFSNNKQVCERVLQSTTSGGAIANDTLMHAGVAALPFGGVGPSGMGAYHGKHSFDTFSHQRAVLVKNLGMEFVNRVRYPPYCDRNAGIVGSLMVEKPHGPFHSMKRFFFKAAVVCAVGAVALRYLPALNFFGNK